LLEADAFVSQRVDYFTYNRNLFRVKPTFKYVTRHVFGFGRFNAVNETDSELEINRTKAFPAVNLT
jgi:hypothetical protein